VPGEIQTGGRRDKQVVAIVHAIAIVAVYSEAGENEPIKALTYVCDTRWIDEGCN
jgi:hypothetical protein